MSDLNEANAPAEVAPASAPTAAAAEAAPAAPPVEGPPAGGVWDVLRTIAPGSVAAPAGSPEAAPLIDAKDITAADVVRAETPEEPWTPPTREEWEALSAKAAGVAPTAEAAQAEAPDATETPDQPEIEVPATSDFSFALTDEESDELSDEAVVTLNSALTRLASQLNSAFEAKLNAALAAKELEIYGGVKTNLPIATNQHVMENLPLAIAAHELRKEYPSIANDKQAFMEFIAGVAKENPGANEYTLLDKMKERISAHVRKVARAEEIAAAAAAAPGSGGVIGAGRPLSVTTSTQSRTAGEAPASLSAPKSFRSIGEELALYAEKHGRSAL